MRPLPVAPPADGGGEGVVAAVRAATQSCQVVHRFGAVREAIAAVVDFQPLGRVATAAAEAIAGQSLPA